MSKYYFTELEDQILQGDLIYKNTKPNESELPPLGVIITADCDIAQNKAGGRITFLEIITISEYLTGAWATEQIRKFVKNKSEKLLKQINTLIDKPGSEFEPLSENSFLAWIQESDPDEIIDVLKEEKLRTEANIATMKALKIVIGSNTENGNSRFDRLKLAWTTAGENEKNQMEKIRKAFDGSGGFPDYFLLPELPEKENIGFVVQLRSIHSFQANDLFLTEADARIAGRPDAYFRLGRLDDAIRFAIVQIFAFLFSRIGMAPDFEDSCKTATDLILESHYSSANGNKK